MNSPRIPAQAFALADFLPSSPLAEGFFGSAHVDQVPDGIRAGIPDESRLGGCPVVQNLAGTQSLSTMMVFQQGFKLNFICNADAKGNTCSRLISRRQTRFPEPLVPCCSDAQLAIFVVNEGNTARHTCCEVAAGFTQHQYGTAGHVFTAVVTSAFNYGPLQSDRRTETTRPPPHGRRLHPEVAPRTERCYHDDVLARFARKSMLGRDDDLWPPTNLSAGVVVGFTDQVEGNAQKGRNAKA